MPVLNLCLFILAFKPFKTIYQYCWECLVCEKDNGEKESLSVTIRNQTYHWWTVHVWKKQSNSCCNHSQPNPNYHRYWVYNLAPSPAKPTIFKWLKSMQDHYKLPLTEVSVWLQHVLAGSLLEYVWSCRLQKELLCLRFFKRGRDLQSVTVSCWSLSWLKPFEGWTNSFGKGPENDTQHKCQTSCLMFTCTMQM